MKSRARSLAPVVVVWLCLGVAGPALAQPYPPPQTACGVSDTTVQPGQTITVTGSGFPPNSEVTISLSGGIVLGTVTTDDNGSFTTQVTIPADLEPGSYSLGCAGVEGRTIRTELTVVEGAGLSFTGSTLNVPVWVLMIGVLLGSGIVFVTAGRVRRRRQDVGIRS